MSAGPLVLSVNATATDGGDGLVGDAAVFAELGCRAACVATAVLAAAADKLHALEAIPAPTVASQFAAVLDEGRPSGVRVGVVAHAAQAQLLSELLRGVVPEGTVYAPVVRAAGASLLDRETHEGARRFLFPLVRAVVARATDLAILAGRDAEDLDGLRDAAAAVRAQGARAVVVAGLLLRGRVYDLVDDDGTVSLLDATRVQAPHVRGLSGAYAAALAAHLARGADLRKAAEAAQRYVGFRLARGR
jgi:hydroxymethylpyrimidine/phosphomethylpyrimidine kinase